jgi:hypothetical protein
MTLKLKALLEENKITKFEYKTYMMYCSNDMGREYLKDAVESSFMEEAIQPMEDCFAWIDGRKSVWRDIKVMINKVQYLMENNSNDR